MSMEMSQWLITAELAYQAQEEIKRLEEHKKELLNQLKDLSGNESRMEKPFFFKKMERDGSIQYAKIDLLKGINLESYRGPKVEIWKLEKI